MVMSREQNAGQSHSMKIAFSADSFVFQFAIQKFKGYDMQNYNLKIKIYRTIILPVVLYGCETLSLTLR